MTDVLRDVFQAFAGGMEMDGRAWVKCLKDSGLLDERLKTVQADLIFARHKPKGHRRISYDLFIQALTEVAMKRDLLPEEAVDRVCLAHGPDYESSTAFEDAPGAGPERFFYDKTTYTGMHKCSSASGQLVARPNRSSRDLPESWASPEDYDLPKSGPERFYYDRSTYTGTHKNNGPSAAGSGVGKEGYSDLSVLVRRDVVQDDVLQRRRRSKTTSPNASGTLPVLLGGGGGGQSFKPKDTKAETQPTPPPVPIEALKPASTTTTVQQAVASSPPMMGQRVPSDIPSTFNALSSASLGALGAWPGLGPPAYVPPVMAGPGGPRMPMPTQSPPQMAQAPQAVPPASWSPQGYGGYPSPVQRWPVPAAVSYNGKAF